MTETDTNKQIAELIFKQTYEERMWFAEALFLSVEDAIKQERDDGRRPLEPEDMARFLAFAAGDFLADAKEPFNIFLCPEDEAVE